MKRDDMDFFGSFDDKNKQDDFDTFDDFNGFEEDKQGNNQDDFELNSHTDSNREDFRDAFDDFNQTNQQEPMSFDEPHDEFSTFDDNNGHSQDNVNTQNSQSQPHDSKINQGYQKYDGWLNTFLLKYVGLRAGGLLFKLVKWGITLTILAVLVIGVVGYLIVGKIVDTFSGDDTGVGEHSGVQDVAIEDSYRENYLSLISTTVGDFGQPITAEGMVFKVLEVNPYNDIASDTTEREFIQVVFAVHNQNDAPAKLHESDFRLYAPQSLEVQGVDTIQYEPYVEPNYDTMTQRQNALYHENGQPPIVINYGDGASTLGTGNIPADHVFSSYVVFEVMNAPGDYILGFTFDDVEAYTDIRIGEVDR